MLHPRGVLTFSPLLLLLLTPSGCAPGGDSHAHSGAPPVTVEMHTVRTETIRDVVDLLGALEAAESVNIRSEAEGIIATVEFEEGHEVAAGALLFRLRDDEERALYNEAQARLVLAQEEYGRAETLFRKNAVSQSELDRARAELRMAEAQRNRRDVELKRMEIRAPFEGVLGARLVSPGDRVDSSVDLVRLDAVDQLRLLFTLPEIALALARVGMQLDIKVVPFPDEKFSGEVYFVAPSLDPRNRRLLVKGLVDNPDHRLRPGMFANIRVEISRKDDALVVPEAAIAYDAQGSFVWRVRHDSTPERVAVQTGIRRANRVEITSGLNAGDRIVSGGTHKVNAGSIVSEAPSSPALPEEQQG